MSNYKISPEFVNYRQISTSQKEFESININKVLEKLKFELESTTQENTLFHEIIHYLDSYRTPRDNVDISSLDTYVNNPKEYNAYYQEAVDRVDKLIDSKSEETKDFILKTILKDKNLDIIFKFSELHWFLDNISLKYRNKLLKRLYGYIINKLEGRI